MTSSQPPLRRLLVILGDQLDEQARALADFDPAQDRIWMAEVMEESTHVPSSKARTALFLSAMRHFAARLRDKGWPVDYTELDDPNNSGSLQGELGRAITTLQPHELVMTAPGDWRVWQALKQVAHAHQRSWVLHDDTHFFTTVRDFAAHAKGRKQLRMEYWYRELRQRFDILMDSDHPVGGQWNFDADNRASFGKTGPQNLPAPHRFAPDSITQSVIELVTRVLPNAPGQLADFAWPVTRTQALQALDDFITHRLPLFGQYEDAMWADEPWLYHSQLSACLNLKLLSAHEVVQAAQTAWAQGHAPLPAVEGFVRQILGWREYVRGMYWTQMPGYIERNALDAQEALPAVYWTGETDMACLRDAVQQTLRYGYAHHIQRLMVLGLYGLLRGVHPQHMHAWFLSVYVDAVEWVELPNTLGMSQFGDGGLMASKPYVATGKYIQRMSNHCQGCRFDPAQSTGPEACPYTTLYWDFLHRHQSSLARNPRMAMQLKNLQRLDASTLAHIQQQAQAHRAST
jgi:deoxyribodipyrimidine photolyase-related protein